MEQTPQKETAILMLTFNTDPVCALGGNYISDFVKLDQILLNELSENIDEITIHGHPSGSAYSILQIQVVYKLQIIKGSKKYNETLQKQCLGPPLPSDEFEQLKAKHRQLISKIISYLSWRKGYYIKQGYIYEHEIQWHWEMEGCFGDNSHEPKHTYEVLGVYEIIPIIPEAPGVISVSDFRDFYALHKEEKAIPLHHEILREVKLGINQSRSGYLILYSALEVATKALIKYKKPDTKWLIEEIQSPHLHKLYTEYINKEIETNIASDADLKNIKNMTSTRNNIAHRGESPSEDVLGRHSTFVRKFIAKIDVAMGHEWAVETEES